MPHGAEWSHWGQKYFRYDIYQEQQALLAHLTAKFGTKALVLYASPALEDINDLVSAKMKGDLIENTNFRRASELSGHHRNTYIRAGAHLYAWSDPENIENFDLLALLEQQRPIENESTSATITSFAAEVRVVVMESAAFGMAYQTLMQPYIEARLENYPYFLAIASMSAVRDITGIQWVLAIEHEYV
jgi:hypothetical protein